MRLSTFTIVHAARRTTGVDLDRLAAAVRGRTPTFALQEVDRDPPRTHLADLTAVRRPWRRGHPPIRPSAVRHPRRELDGAREDDLPGTCRALTVDLT